MTADLAQRFVKAMRRAADGCRAGRNAEVRLRASDWHRLLDLAQEAESGRATSTGGEQ